MLKPGIYTAEQLSDTDYHADHDTISSSVARELVKPGGPAKVKYNQEHPGEETAALRFGRATHAAIVEQKQVLVSPHDTFYSKAAKQWRADHEGQTWVTGKEHDQIETMRTAIKTHSDASKLLGLPGRPEVTIVWEHYSGATCKARIDFLPDSDIALVIPIIDYKTARDATPKGFAKAVANFGYFQQAAWYLDALHAVGYADALQFMFIVQEKEPPYQVGVYELSERAIKLGRELNETAIDIWNECQKTNEWPGLSDAAVTIDLPNWCYYEWEVA